MGTKRLKKAFDVLAALTLVAIMCSLMAFGLSGFFTSLAFGDVSEQKIYESVPCTSCIASISEGAQAVEDAQALAIAKQSAAAEAEQNKVKESSDRKQQVASTSVNAYVYEAKAQARTITINGISIPYVNAFGAAVAPYDTAGLWDGSDSVTDGTYGYFIGHNPGLFKDVPNLRTGSTVSVCDSNSNIQTYQVVDVFDVSKSTYLHQIEDRINGYGESIVIQTCLPNAYRVVVAQAI